MGSTSNVGNYESQWPKSCLYADIGTMNMQAIVNTMDTDTTHDPKQQTFGAQTLPSTMITQCRDRSVRMSTLDDQGRQYMPTSPELPTNPSTHNPDEQATVLFLGQRRTYGSATTSNMYLSKDTWYNVLSDYNVLPSFIEVLHCNNFACTYHTSYRQQTLADGTSSSISPDAFHVCLKVGNWTKKEFALYARQEIQTGRVFVLFVGTKDSCNPQHVYDRMREFQRPVNMFDVILMFMDTIQSALDAARWQCDYRTRELEQMTGYAHFPKSSDVALPLSQLGFNKKLQGYSAWTNVVLYGFERYQTILQSLQQYLDIFVSLTSSFPPNEPVPCPKPHEVDLLKSALRHKASLLEGHTTQTRQLLLRIEAQMNVTRSLVAERDAAISIEIGKAAKQDSAIMRGIALVTMVFLPATFAATFFSMVFFHVNDGERPGLVVEGHVWLYPLVTVPVTVAMAYWYYRQSKSKQVMPDLERDLEKLTERAQANNVPVYQ